jgi:hypothetical protein
MSEMKMSDMKDFVYKFELGDCVVYSLLTPWFPARQDINPVITAANGIGVIVELRYSRYYPYGVLFGETILMCQEGNFTKL